MLGVERFTANFTTKFWWERLQLKRPDRREKTTTTTTTKNQTKPNGISTTQHNWQLHAFAGSKLLPPAHPPPCTPTDSVLPTPFPLLIIPQQKDGAHQTHRGKSWPWHRLIVAPASGNPDRARALAGTREAASLEIFPPKEWRGWSLSKREVLILLPAREPCFSRSLSLCVFINIYLPSGVLDHTTFSAPD